MLHFLVEFFSIFVLLTVGSDSDCATKYATESGSIRNNQGPYVLLIYDSKYDTDFGFSCPPQI